jgi:LPS-assembly protein
MKNNKFILYIILILNLILFTQTKSEETFNFDVTEAEITNNGNTFKGKKRGIASTEDGIFITADNFEYDKILNILYANGNVILDDTLEGVKIFTEDITYLKNKEIIFTKGRSKATDQITTIDGDKFEYNKFLNKLNAKGNVIINDIQADYLIYAEDITYLKNKEIIFTKGETDAIIESDYIFKSKDVFLFRNEMELSSAYKSSLLDNSDSTLYNFDNFKYIINKKIIKGENIGIITNYLKAKSDKTYFKNGMFNLLNKNFLSTNIEILLHKDLFDKERITIQDDEDELKKFEKFKGKNDPRILGVSSSGDINKTVINKGIFTSCKKNDTCPPWSLKAETITHDKNKKEIMYKNAIVNIYDVPVFYFPKFFHPDPSVKRRSGLLQPRLNNSDILGTSINLPYFHVISSDKDYTFKPTIFDNRIYMFQNEYRQETKNSSFIADFGYTKGYRSKSSNYKSNGMSHIFSKLDINLGFDSFSSSKLDIFFEKVSMDTFLSIFDPVLLTDKSLQASLEDHGTMTSGLKLALDHEDYSLTVNTTVYESLGTSKNSDRFQYVFPSYDFSTILFSNINGSLNFNSNGYNNLSSTNNLKSLISNNLSYNSNSIYSETGFVFNYGVFFRNLNSIAKNDVRYKTSPQAELMNIYEVNAAFPLLKELQTKYNYITPRVSFRINPSDMKNHSNGGSLITTDNAFSINRLGLSESYESGKTITLGLDYKSESKFDNEKFFEVKLAGILRDTPEYKIPQSSSAQGTTSNLFGSIENTFSKYLTVDYNFSLDNNFNTFEYNQLETTLTVNNFVTEFRFSEQNGKIGDSNILENTTTLNLDGNNSLAFKTRRNRKISLTEYYDFIYEYETDCLTAGIKYRKSYYTDRDLTPKEDLFFTITLFPLTTLDQEIDKNLYRDRNNDVIWK